MILERSKLAVGAAIVGVAILGALPLFAMASGSEGVSTGETSDAQLYNVGKSVYAQKLACTNCPMSGKPLNASVAKELLAGNQTQSLSADEKSALTAYLKRRFKL
jgi:hypothetical protein